MDLKTIANMIKIITEILKNRNIIPNMIKTAFWIVPIILITNNIYKYYMGNYDFHWFLINKETVINAIVCILIFGSIACISLWFENFILPLLFASKKDLMTQKSKVYSNKVIKRIFSYNPLNYIKSIPKNEFYRVYTYLPCTIILWLIAFNSIISYIAILILLIPLYYYKKIINSIYNEFTRNI